VKTHHLLKVIASSSLVVFCPVAANAAIVVPNSLATSEANGGFRVLIAPTAHTYQMLIGSSELTGISIGDLITGVAFRLDSGQLSEERSFTNFDITLAQATNTFGVNVALNMSNPVLVRSGALSLAADYFPTAGTPNGFAAPFAFDSPYTYTGGALVALFSHSGGGGSPILLDSTNSTEDITSITARYDTSYNSPAVRVGATFVTVTQFQVIHVPEPSAIVLSVIGFAGIMHRRNRNERNG
jgi:hypothetical protein